MPHPLPRPWELNLDSEEGRLLSDVLCHRGPDSFSRRFTEALEAAVTREKNLPVSSRRGRKRERSQSPEEDLAEQDPAAQYNT